MEQVEAQGTGREYDRSEHQRKLGATRVHRCARQRASDEKKDWTRNEEESRIENAGAEPDGSRHHALPTSIR
ncbi:MAG TPA: hypothetical protein VEF35_04505 [Candidatus Bathyarchaeia archaeon]|nr:hypothetical protein [Candidatus Bathyarchaeia archaeon]